MRALRLPVPLSDTQTVDEDDDVTSGDGQVEGGSGSENQGADGASAPGTSLGLSEDARALSRPPACLVGLEPTRSGDSILIVTGDPWAAADAAAAAGIGPGPGPGRLLGRVQNREMR